MIKTEVRVSPDQKHYEIWYQVGTNPFKKHPKQFGSIDSAMEETVSIKGHFRLLSDLTKKS